jgi:REP element-mobilizing transposase RayT
MCKENFMPRKARIDGPGALHHIIVRGIEKGAIFKDRHDNYNFLDRLGDILSDTTTPCFSWALLFNHFHLLLRTGLTPIAKVMQRLLTGYAQQFNRRHKRHGQLFQNRYKSILCEEDAYFLELVRYIHMNPLRAGEVKDLKQLSTYPFSGHHILMGKNDHDWQDTEYVLSMFGHTTRGAIKAYSMFMAKGVTAGRRPELVGGGLIRSVGGWSALKGYRRIGLRIKGDERILGSSEFVQETMKQANEQLAEKARIQAEGPSLEAVVEKVANYFQVDIEDLQSSSKARRISRARSMVSYLAVRKLMISCADVARLLKVSPSTVSKAVIKGREANDLKIIQKDILGF